MPVEIRRLTLGTPPQREITRGPLKGQYAPQHQVILPGWDDIIHIIPEGMLTKVERSVLQQRRLAQLRNSPSPEVVRNFARIGQAIDDIQDAAVTLSVAGRLAVKLRGKSIPGVGAITTAADVINIMNIFYPTAAGKALAGAGDRIGAKLTGRRKYLVSKEIKRSLGLSQGESMSTYLRRLEETLKTGKVSLGIGEVLQILQTSDALFGVGVSLGPIFGALQDHFFGVLRGARYDLSGPLGLVSGSISASALAEMQANAPGSYDLYARRARDLAEQQGLAAPADPVGVARIIARNPVRVQVDFPGVLPLAEQLIGLRPGVIEEKIVQGLKPITDFVEPRLQVTVDMLRQGKEAAVGAALKVWNAGKWIAGVRHDLSWEDHLLAVVAQALAVQELSPLMQQSDWGSAAARDARQLEPDLPFCDSSHDHSRSAIEVATCLARGRGRESYSWLDQIPFPEAREFAEEVLIQSAGDFLHAAEGPGAKVAEDSGGAFRAIRMLHDYNLLPPYERSDAELEKFITSVLPLMPAFGEHLPAISVISDLYVRCFPGVES